MCVSVCELCPVTCVVCGVVVVPYSVGVALTAVWVGLLLSAVNLILNMRRGRRVSPQKSTIHLSATACTLIVVENNVICVDNGRIAIGRRRSK